MVRPDRFELPTFWFVARRSIQLSYGRSRPQYNNPVGVLKAFGSARDSACASTPLLSGFVDREHLDAIAAARFGAVQGFICYANEHVGISPGIVGNSCSEASRYAQLGAVYQHGARFQFLAHPLSLTFRLLQIAVGKNYQKFLASVPPHLIVGSHVAA